MDVLAVIVMSCAVVVFVFEATIWRLDTIRFGLTLMALALICQFTNLSSHHLHT